MAHDILKKLGFDSDPIIGIDIGSSAIKAMLVSRHKDGKLYIDNVIIKSLPSGAVHEKNIGNLEIVIESLHEICQDNIFKTKKVCFSLPNSMAITRIIEMDSDYTEKEIGTEITIEADRYIPYSIDDVNLDYQVLGRSSHSDELVDVVLAVAKTEYIEDKVNMFQQAGFTPEVVDIESFSLARAFKLVTEQIPNEGRDKLIGLVDIGSTMLTINIYLNEKTLYTREQAFGGSQLTIEVLNRYGLTEEELSQARKYNDLPDDYYIEVLEPFRQSIAQQVNRACQFFFSSGNYSYLDYIFITGGTAKIPGLEELIHEKTGIKTFVANPFVGFEIQDSELRELINDNYNSLLLCCGLALRNLEK